MLQYENQSNYSVSCAGMSIAHVAAIEEFNEYFPDYCPMTPYNYRKFKAYYNSLRMKFFVLMPFRSSYASAMSLEVAIEEWLDRNPDKRTRGLTGEWAVDIFADHNERIMEEYRKYKSERLQKLEQTKTARKRQAQAMILHLQGELKWLMGRVEYEKMMVDVMRMNQKR